MSNDKREKAEIHWDDETDLYENSQHGRSFVPRTDEIIPLEK